MKWGSSYRVGKYEYRRYSRSLWLKVFFHNMTTFVGFSSESEAKQCNSVYKYSILSELNGIQKQSNGKYEFILEYPEHDSMNQWQQTNSPLEETEHGQKEVVGYKEIHIGESSSKWGGLAKSSDAVKQYTLINGSPVDTTGMDWGFAIGMYNGVYWGHYNLPAGEHGATNIVYLWVKVPKIGCMTNIRCPYHNNLLFYISLAFS